MFTILILCLLAVVAVALFALSFWLHPSKVPLRIGAAVLAVVTVVLLLLTSFTSVSPSTVGVVTTFGKVSQEVLPEGAHLVAPWSKVTEVYLGQQQETADKSEAGSKDLQSVHAKLAVNFTVDPVHARDLYVINPALNYSALIVKPAIYEVFKAIVAQYTAEELITKRQDVSRFITEALRTRLSPYHLKVQTVNLMDFGFSRAFDAAIEEKVTASQKAETARRNLERVRFEADARIAQAEGEAKAIAIQSQAIQDGGGAGYVQLQAIQKWNGQLPQYVTSGSALPFVNVK